MGDHGLTAPGHPPSLSSAGAARCRPPAGLAARSSRALLMRTFDLDIEVTRGELVESRHRVHAAVVDASDRLVGVARDASGVTHWRSCAKPFQIMPFLADGGFDRLGWAEDELALGCASHGGEPEHVSLAGSMLTDIGLEEGDLACGPHDPLSPRGLKILRDSGVRAGRLHNNCSGKHAAMLGRAFAADWPSQGYEAEDHPVQQSIRNVVAEWTGVPAGRLIRATDGCGVVVFGLPLEAMARGYARLGVAAQRGDEIPARIIDAIRSRPFIFGGTDRFDSVLIEETDGAIIAKVGAEGVHSAVVLESGMGIAVKVEDGAQRAQYAAVLRLLQLIGALPARLPARLEDFIRRPVRNTRGVVVGQVRPVA